MQLHLEAGIGEYCAWLDRHPDTEIIAAGSRTFNPLLHWLNYENEDGPFSLNADGNLCCGALRVLAPGWIMAIISDYMTNLDWRPEQGVRLPITALEEHRRIQRLRLK